MENADSTYEYSPLPRGPNSFRILRILPQGDLSSTSRPRCQLHHYSPDEAGVSTPRYEALSYVWGDRRIKKAIEVNGKILNVTENLYAALLQLRARAVEHIWIDAICINQEDIQERGHQVGCMARIYGMAYRVIVWLGEEVPGTTTAFEAISNGNTQANEAGVKEALLDLLNRPWFRRIWVLQEVAAARRILITCGTHSIPGNSFCAGLKRLQSVYSNPLTLYNRIRAITFLIRQANFRPTHGISWESLDSLRIRPLSHLLDMYHSQEASEKHDKVYALLGMTSDISDLIPDYGIPWSRLYHQTVQLILGEKAKITTRDNSEVAVLWSKVKFIGKVVAVSPSSGWGDEQKVTIELKNTSKYIGPAHGGTKSLTLQASAKPIQPGDLLCRLGGASWPTIIRRRIDHFSIILIAVTIPDENRGSYKESTESWRSVIADCPLFPQGFTLVWNWSNSTHFDEEGKGLLFDVVYAYGNTYVPKFETVDRVLTMALFLEAVDDLTAAKDMYDEAAWTIQTLFSPKETATTDSLAYSFPGEDNDDLSSTVTAICHLLHGRGFADTAKTVYNMRKKVRTQKDARKPKESQAEITRLVERAHRLRGKYSTSPKN